MKSLGYLLIAAGFLGGSYVAVLDADSVPVGRYLPLLAVGVVGVVLARLAGHRESRDVEVVAANIGAIGSSLERIVDKTRAFDRDKETIDVYELRHHVDREFPGDLDTFAQARQSIAHSFGLESYANVMNCFAAGERYLNRVWSASTDGYVDEAHEYVTKAHEQFEEALAVFRALEKR
jgi:hypothetical protein